jgi:hypothetical protein
MHESLTSNDKRVFIFQENIGEVRNICLPKKKRVRKHLWPRIVREILDRIKEGKNNKITWFSRLWITGGLGSSWSAIPRTVTLKSFTWVWLIKKFGVGFGIWSSWQILFTSIYYHERILQNQNQKSIASRG